MKYLTNRLLLSNHRSEILRKPLASACFLGICYVLFIFWFWLIHHPMLKIVVNHTKFVTCQFVFSVQMSNVYNQSVVNFLYYIRVLNNFLTSSHLNLFFYVHFLSNFQLNRFPQYFDQNYNQQGQLLVMRFQILCKAVYSRHISFRYNPLLV